MRFKKAGILTIIVILAIVVYAVSSLVSLKSQMSEAREKRDALQVQVDKEQQINAELQYAISHSEDPETLEDIARNKLGLVKPGEKIFYDIND